MSDSPQVSVIIPAYRDLDQLPACLAALERQRTCAAYEIILVISGIAEYPTPALPDSDHRQLVQHGERLFAGSARNLGASRAQGRLLLFIDADCELAEDGLQRLLDTQARYGDAFIGAVFEPDPAANWVGAGYYFTSLTTWVADPASEPRAVDALASGCCALSRELFQRFGPFPDLRYGEDTALSWKLARAGIGLLLDPGLRVCHKGVIDLDGLLRRAFRHGVVFSRMRAREKAWTPARRVLQVATAPLLPCLLLLRNARAIWPVAALRLHFLRVSPVILLVWGVWVAGETRALLADDGIDS